MTCECVPVIRLWSFVSKPSITAITTISAPTPRQTPKSEISEMKERKILRFFPVRKRFASSGTIGFRFASFPSISGRASLGPHLREEDDVADRGLIREQHHEAVNADPLARRRRHSIFQRAQEILVHVAGFHVAGGFRVGLLLEALALVNRVVELREAVRHFASVDIELETIDDIRILLIRARKEADLRRKFRDES